MLFRVWIRFRCRVRGKGRIRVSVRVRLRVRVRGRFRVLEILPIFSPFLNEKFFPCLISYLIFSFSIIFIILNKKNKIGKNAILVKSKRI